MVRGERAGGGGEKGVKCLAGARVTERAVNASHLVDRLTCGGQLGLMDTLLRLYRADVTGLKIIIPSLTMDKKNNLYSFPACVKYIIFYSKKRKQVSQCL